MEDHRLSAAAIEHDDATSDHEQHTTSDPGSSGSGSSGSGSSGGSVKSAERVLDIMTLLTRHADGLTFPLIVERLGIPKSSLHALLRTMAWSGHLVLDERARTYRLGVRFWEAGQAFLRGVDLPRICVPYLEAARDELQETIQLAILDGRENVYIAKVEADHRLKLVSEVGGRLPAHATALGKVLLAGLDHEELARRLAAVQLEGYTDRTIVDREQLLAELQRTRERGYGTDQGEYTPGVACVAVPIHDHHGTVTAAMSASAPEVRIRDWTRERMRDVLQVQARDLSAALGYRGEDR